MHSASVCRYDLVSVIVHHGSSTSSGHYIAYVKSAGGQWFIADDSRVASVRIEHVLKQQAYILMHVRREPRHWRLQGPAGASAAHAGSAVKSSKAGQKRKMGHVNDPEASLHSGGEQMKFSTSLASSVLPSLPETTNQLLRIASALDPHVYQVS